MSRDRIYGRIGTIFPSHKVRKKENALYVPVYWMNLACKPAYAYGRQSYLSYESDINYYLLYNPQKHMFKLETMVMDIIAMHRYKHSEIVGSFVIVTDEEKHEVTK